MLLLMDVEGGLLLIVGMVRQKEHAQVGADLETILPTRSVWTLLILNVCKVVKVEPMLSSLSALLLRFTRVDHSSHLDVAIALDASVAWLGAAAALVTRQLHAPGDKERCTHHNV